MIKWVGSKIEYFKSYFKDTVYLESLRDVTIAQSVLTVDGNGEIGKARYKEDANTLSGVTGTDLGTFTGSTIADSRDIKTALQDLETKVETNATTSSKGIASFTSTDFSVSSGDVSLADDAVTFAKASGVTPNVYGNIIKLLPSDFVTNDDAGTGKFGIGYVDHAGTSYGMKPTNSTTELYTFVAIPEGMTATHVDVFDKYDKGVIVYEAQINATTLTSKGTGNCNTTIDITDVDSSATNFLAIQVTTTATSDRVFGGQVTIVAQ